MYWKTFGKKFLMWLEQNVEYRTWLLTSFSIFTRLSEFYVTSIFYNNVILAVLKTLPSSKLQAIIFLEKSAMQIDVSNYGGFDNKALITNIIYDLKKR